MNKAKKIVTTGIKAATVLSLLLLSGSSIYASEVTGNLSSSASGTSQVQGNVGGNTSGGSTVSGTVTGGGTSGGGGSSIGGSVVAPSTGGGSSGGTTPQNSPGQVLGESIVALISPSPSPTSNSTPGLPNTGFGPDNQVVLWSFIIASAGLVGAIGYGLFKIYDREPQE